MAWTIKYTATATDQLRKLDKPTAKRIIEFLSDRIAHLDDPRSMGEALKGPDLGSFWKYRVGDYRIIADIEDQAVRIAVVRVGNRKDVYKKH